MPELALDDDEWHALVRHQAIDKTETIATVYSRPSPVISADAELHAGS